MQRVVADHLDESRLSGLVAIGVDEISWRRGQRYLTSVADHRKGRIVWCAPGRNAQTLQAFFDELGPERTKTSARHASVPGRPKVRGLSIAVQPKAQFAQRIGGQPTTLVNDLQAPVIVHTTHPDTRREPPGVRLRLRTNPTPASPARVARPA